MKSETELKMKNRENEKGAAIVMVILISFLLMIASAGLLLETTMNTANVTDAVAEQQAYYAAESGIQSSLNVLRGNVPPSPLFDTTQDASHPNNRINYSRAVRLSTSNSDNDTSGVARLSRWMNYNYAPNGLTADARVKLGWGNYTPGTGYAYNLNITDPDRTGELLSFNTKGYFFDPRLGSRGWKEGEISIETVGSPSNKVRIVYYPNYANNLDVTSGIADTDFGSFKVEVSGSGATIPEDIRFEIELKMTAPYTASKSLRGWIKAGAVTSNSVPVVFDFDSLAFEVMGSKGTLNNEPMTIKGESNTVDIAGKITPAEPYRLVLRSIGYGPRVARKELEATIQKNFFNGLQAPATLTLIGGTSGFHFEAGESQNVAYSGDDEVTSVLIPPIGTTNLTNLDSVLLNLENRGRKADITGYPSEVQREMPFWLQSPQNLDIEIQKLRNVADKSGRLFQNGAKPGSGDFGNNATATGITFVEGDVNLSGSGGGILIVTGKLTLKGAFNFNGLIIVTGEGGVERSGGGNGFLRGNTVVAPYNPALITPFDNTDPPAQFMAPKYDISGGGNSTIRYNSDSVANGMTAVSNFVLAVAEK